MINALSHRNVKRFIKPQTTTDGAGVRLQRTIGTDSIPDLDPFLLLDHFGSDNPDDYISGFPMHPHRGIETVTYMLRGRIRHRDSVGNSGLIESGGVQWMTAGSGILHEEMPEMSDGGLDGFQLWVNLPAKMKMTRPTYQEFKRTEIPAVNEDAGFTVRVIAGVYKGTVGPVKGLAAASTYFDVESGASKSLKFELPALRSVFCYFYKGTAAIRGDHGIEKELNAPLLAVFEEEGDWIEIQSGEMGSSFLIVGGNTLNEPISRYGPFVMNTREEIETALDELRSGSFIKAYDES